MKSILVILAILVVSQFGKAQSISLNLNVVNRSFNVGHPDHLYSLNPSEGPNAGLKPEPSGNFSLMTNPNLGFALSIYRCKVTGSPEGHFLSNDSSCEAQTKEGFLGYANQGSSSSIFKLVPLYRYVNPKNGDHVTVLGPNSVPGYNYEAPLGYVIPAPVQ